MQQQPDPRRMTLIALVIVVALVAAGFFLADRLHRNAQIQDCAMQGRTNCAPLD